MQPVPATRSTVRRTWGESWNLQQSGATNALRDCNGFVSGTPFVVGDEGTIVKTTNGGLDWIQKPSGTTADLHASLDVVTRVFAAAGENGTILRSTDGGESWTGIDSDTIATIYDMTTSFPTGFYILAVGEGGTVLKSMDAGLTWCLINSGTEVDLYACEMPHTTEFLVKGAGGYMAFIDSDGGGCFDSAAVEDLAAPVGIRLAGPWPQPLSGAGRFEPTTERSRRLRADVVSASGRRIMSLFDARIRAGARRTVPFDASAWPAGVYLIRISSDSQVFGRRVLVVR
ncbi:MAG: hypothetical protein GF355_08325 [Candidatus Eisenbacteria bacterium]|nr:hypothetical protein [Candidatus Eisenbacteria bacterium]